MRAQELNCTVRINHSQVQGTNNGIFETLEKEIAALEEEQRRIEEELCSGTLSIEELTEKSKRLPLLKDELDEKSMRWLELSEIGT
jgi:superfamily I DNA and RNA helicase